MSGGAGDCSLFLFVLWGCCGLGVCVLGAVLNVLAFLTFQLDRRSATTAILQALAVSDFVLLVAVLVTDPIPYLCDYTGSCSNIWHSWPYVRFVWIITPISHMCSIWFVVLVGLNRFWAVCHPHAISIVWSLPRTLMYIGAVFVFVVSFNIPRFFEYRIDVDIVNRTANDTAGDVANGIVAATTTSRLVENKTNLGSSYSYRVIYKSFLVVIVLIVIPLIMLSAMTIKITHVLRRQSQRKQVASNGSTPAHNVPTTPKHLTVTRTGSTSTPTKTSTTSPGSSSDITTLLILVVIVAIVANTPLCIFHFVRISDPSGYGCGEAGFYLESVSKLLVNINSCADFLLYCVFSPRFRNIIINRIIMKLFSRCLCKSEDELKTQEYPMEAV